MNARNARGCARRSSGGVDARTAAEAIINGVPNLVINLDERDLPSGALTSWIDRKNAYNFSGTATKDASGVTFNGTSNILTSTAAISQVNGVAAVTVVFAASDTNTAATAIPIEHGPLGTSAGKFSIYLDSSGNRLHSFGYLTGQSDYYAAETLATPCVMTTQVDFSLATGEANLIRKNGAALGTTLVANVNNAGTFGSFTLNLGARFGGSLWWAGSFRKILVYARALTAGEMLQVERAVGTITNISVA